MHLYVYYEVPGDATGDVLVRVRAMQVAVGGDARLMRRADRGADTETWMEVYADVPPDFEKRLAAAVEEHELAEAIGARHVERFEDVA